MKHAGPQQIQEDGQMVTQWDRPLPYMFVGQPHRPMVINRVIVTVAVIPTEERF